MKEHILAFMRKRWPYYIMGILLIIVSALLLTSFPKYLGYAIDALKLVPANRDEALRDAGMMVFCATAGFATKLGWRCLIVGSGRSIEYYIRERLFEKLQALPASFYNENKTGDLITRAIVDIQSVRRLFALALVNTVDITVTVTVSIGFILTSTDLATTIAVLSPLPVVVAVLYFLRKVLRRRFLALQESIAAISDKVQENTVGIRILKGFAQEEWEGREFASLSQKKTRAEMRMGQISSLLGPVTAVTFGFSFALFLILGAHMVAAGTLSVGSYVAVNSYITLMIAPVSNISRVVEVWQTGRASITRLNHIFYAGSNLDQNADSHISEIKPTIRVNDLTFSYKPGLPPVLSHLSFTLPKGGSLGIMGPTGSGKTTLASLLLKVYPVEYGRIFYGGQDINRIPSAVLRTSIGYVPQDGFLFSDTIANNIAFYDSGVTPEMVRWAAKRADLLEDITQFPAGFDTVTGERGVTLSGGQKQRVSIARALVRHAPLMILDDCLSAVDARTEQAILRNIHEDLAGATSIIISHRVSSVMHCDEILFLDGGQVAERGSHEQLMTQKGRYYALYMEQNQDIGMEE